jgi:hypothetical protein
VRALSSRGPLSQSLHATSHVSRALSIHPIHPHEDLPATSGGQSAQRLVSSVLETGVGAISGMRPTGMRAQYSFGVLQVQSTHKLRAGVTTRVGCDDGLCWRELVKLCDDLFLQGDLLRHALITRIISIIVSRRPSARPPVIKHRRRSMSKYLPRRRATPFARYYPTLRASASRCHRKGPAGSWTPHGSP